MKLSLISCSKGIRFRVHAAGCADVPRDIRKYRGDDKWDLDAASKREVASEMFGPSAGSFYEEAGGAEVNGSLDEYLDGTLGEFHFAPCCSSLPAKLDAKKGPLTFAELKALMVEFVKANKLDKPSGNRTAEKVKDENVLWFVALQLAGGYSELGTKDIAHLFLGGVPKLTRAGVAEWLATEQQCKEEDGETYTVQDFDSMLRDFYGVRS